jgi:hypothetical protein
MASLDPDGAVLFGRRTAGGPTFPDIVLVVHPRPTNLKVRPLPADTEITFMDPVQMLGHAP